MCVIQFPVWSLICCHFQSSFQAGVEVQCQSSENQTNLSSTMLANQHWVFGIFYDMYLCMYCKLVLTADWSTSLANTDWVTLVLSRQSIQLTLYTLSCLHNTLPCTSLCCWSESLGTGWSVSSLRKGRTNKYSIWSNLIIACSAITTAIMKPCLGFICMCICFLWLWKPTT